VQQAPIPYVGPSKFVHALVLHGASKAALDRYTLGLAADGTTVIGNALMLVVTTSTNETI
jgi:3-oxoacyl-[acyl-carrier protein] reductase